MKARTGTYVYTLIAALGLLSGISAALHTRLDASFTAVSVLLVALTVRWFRRDNVVRGYTGILDRGMFILMGGHVILPLYLLWTRRGKGALLILLAFIIFIIPALVAIFLVK